MGSTYASPYRLTDIKVYGEIGDNPALNEIARSPRMFREVAKHTRRVREVYDATAPLDHGTMIASTEIDVFIGGYDHKRWVGEVTVKVPYAMASERGRHAYNPYEGSHALEDALYAVLPTRI